MTGDAFVELGGLLKVGHATQRRCWAANRKRSASASA
jgi:hypothetical protein